MRSACRLAPRALVLAAGLLFGEPAEPKRRALVIGNGEYKSLPAMSLAGDDARAMARSLTARRFEVALLVNLEIDAMAREIGKFLKSLQPGEGGVFYFAGYGGPEMGENFLLPGVFSMQTVRT